MSNFIHPMALVESDLIGDYNKIWAFTHILYGAVIGTNCNIGDHCFIESGARIGNNVTIKNHVCIWEGVIIEDDVFLGPNMVFTNDRYPRSPRMAEVKNKYSVKDKWLEKTFVGKGSAIGANATIIPGIQIGSYSFIAAGSTVTKNVAPFSLMVGSPAIRKGYMCACGGKVAGPFPPQFCSNCKLEADYFNNVINCFYEKVKHEYSISRS